MSRVQNTPTGDTRSAAGSATGPAASASIATIAATNLPAGWYRVYVKTGFAGVAGTANDFAVYKGATDVATPLLAIALASTLSDRVLDRVALDGTQALIVIAIAGHATGVYVAEIQATKID